ncbi:pro-neuregulin-3, membrane-bound isoform isoform X4 [Heterocephalus glaber]|uniref:Pro-neuregulin-3, membrane-bound isoform n=1 Tax=Heterocephalus glaber TaxID=10181 RepID=A0AAX6S449_HETGA|nr:pro-neuregulin-3, membrane-bound isoform isoform X4 [Heterocephalus glaber]
MSEGAAAASPPGAASAAAASAEEGTAAAAASATGGGPDGGGGGEGAAEPPRELRCSDCIVWNRQQTWLCVVPLFIGFIGLGLSLMLLKWIVVGSVKEYVPTDLVDSKGMGQDPFFLSKPSSFPKAMETTTTTTSTTSPATPSAGGSSGASASSRTPNRISTRLTTITRAPTRFPGHRVPIRASPRSTTARNTGTPPTVLSTTTAPFFSSSTLGTRPPAPGSPSTQAMPSWPTAAYATSSYLHDSTPSWTLSPFQDAAASSFSSSSSSTTTTTTTLETSTSPKFHTTTYSTQRSEHFKPCRDKDLAYCLNDGECFVIETLTGSHKHCRCKEGYQGVRCDQFLPKTDSILSDPTDHLGIEFMESEEVYQRQVLSISCIIFGIVIVGMFCAAFYFKSKKQAKQIQEQLKESQNGKNYSLKASSMMAKSESLMKSHVQLQNYSKAERHPVTALEKMMESSFGGPQPFPTVPSPDRGSQSVKQHSRSLSSCCSPGQRSGMLHRNAFRRTPPSPRSRLGGIVGPAYQQLEESRIPDQDTIPCQGYSSNGLKTQQNASINMQLPSRETNPYFNNLDQKDLVGYSSTRASSVPIIPSVGLEETCMQMPGISEVKSIKWCKNSYSADIVNVSIPVSDCFIAEQQEVKILLETVQEQIRILTDARRSEDYELASVETEDSASENTAFLPLSPTAKSEREAQFVLRNEIQRDSALTK